MASDEKLPNAAEAFAAVLTANAAALVEAADTAPAKSLADRLAGQEAATMAAAVLVRTELAPKWDALTAERDDFRRRLEGALLAEAQARVDLAAMRDERDHLQARLDELEASGG